MKRILLSAVSAFFALTVSASVSIQQAQGWFESGYVTWSAVSGASTYHVYVAAQGSDSWMQLDQELVRQYPDYYRADALGLKAGQYQFRVVPVCDGVEAEAEATVTSAFTVAAHDRSGFAHVGMQDGIGAYNNDGTLKDGAKVIYVWADNAKTVSTPVQTGSTASRVTNSQGLQDLVYLYQKGYETTPLAIRIIGTIKADDMDSFGSSAEGLQVKGKNEYAPMPITIEGVGDDAAIWGFGILCRNCHGTEFRNFGIMLCMDDCLSLDTGNSNVWVHNMDLFYGNTGGDADQAKGDGTIDVKGLSRNITISYNHFYDSGKCSLGGMKSESTDCWLSYHHNWFDHSDSRHPRIRTMFFHIYNNYFDGNSKYGVGMTMGGSAFVEQNYFRNCKYPMLISLQGTDAEGSGTFSGENGGVIKAFENTIVNPRKVQYYDGQQTNGRWDAVLVQSRDEDVHAVAYAGGTGYNAEADLAARSTYVENQMDLSAQVPSVVKGHFGAGRMNHGDFSWQFNNSLQDENYDVISSLKTALQNYRSSLVGFADGTSVRNGGASSYYVGGDGVGIDPEVNDAYVPSWAGGGGGTTSAGSAFLATDLGNGTYDYFWCTSENSQSVNALLADGTLVLDEGSKFQTTSNVSGSDGTVYSDKQGSLQLAKGTGFLTIHCPAGITSLGMYLVRTGSMKGDILGSYDGVSFTQLDSYSGSKGVKELNFVPSEPYPYLRVTNTATGSLHIQGLLVMKPAGEQSIHTLTPDVPNTAAPCYNLQGQRLTSPRGLFIEGGRLKLIR